MPNLDERRSQPRAELVAPAVVFLANERVDCRVMDISTGGIALRSPVASTPGQFLRIDFSLAPQGGVPRWHEADGVVVRAAATPSGAILGVRFLVVDDRLVREVHDHVARRRSSASLPAIPDALHPPPTTGEFNLLPDDASVWRDSTRRRTGKYGAVAPRVASPRPAPPRGDLDLLQLYRDALREVEGRPRTQRFAKK
jgi:hypothetical protein